ncbi:transmembrane emp24 domain-containing protein p24beta2-like, partial [Eucalyptus grandis]|uniref:transmembrane emp24 domain-containing protein p24beta2-like n=1 Tax=Eucalyptus grandis TaxID=71139 RepID=UPI00192F0817
NFQVKGPSGEQIQDFHNKISEKFEFVAHHKGVHRFCFTKKSPYHETIDFDVHVGHFTFYDQHAKDVGLCFFFFSVFLSLELTNFTEYTACVSFLSAVNVSAEHFNPLLEQIGKLEEALYNIQFEQHWLEAETERQAIVNDAMSRRAVHKAFFESAALIGSSVLQVYLLRRLFERKLGFSRV